MVEIDRADNIIMSTSKRKKEKKAVDHVCNDCKKCKREVSALILVCM